MSTTDGGHVVVLGAGNPLLGDDGFGQAVLDSFARRYDVPDGVELVDGGIWGMNLLPAIEDADALIIVDAIDIGWPAGSPVELERASIPRMLGIKLSPHQIDLREALAVAELRGRFPQRAVAIGVQPLSVTTHIGLSPVVQAGVDTAADLVAARLRRWGWPCRPADNGICTS